MKEIFPLDSTTDPTKAESALPLAKDCAWDFEHDMPLLRGGEPVAVTGTEAVKVWAYNAIKTDRYCHAIWTPQYACELDRLVGQAFSEDTKRAQAVRYLEECLTVSPYITAVSVNDLSLTGSTLNATVSIRTIYEEEATLHV